MLLRIVLVLVTCFSSTLSQMDSKRLDEIRQLCFQHRVLENGKYYVNGQEKPLANSMENFIGLVEKLEARNPTMSLRDEVQTLLKMYTAENVYYMLPKYGSPALGIWTPTPTLPINDILDDIFDVQPPEYEDPFENGEKCSLFFMLSHTVNDTARPGIDPLQRSYVPSVVEEPLHANGGQSTHTPREQGVVSLFQIKTYAVAINRVLVGLLAGLTTDAQRMKNRDSFRPIENDLQEVPDNLDLLYLSTLADQLIYSHYPLERIDKGGIGKSGVWTTVERTEKDFPLCPTIYELPDNQTSAYTYSSIRGGIDGLILGEFIRDITSQGNVRLSQILRMYYSRSGLLQTSRTSTSFDRLSFCNQFETIATLEEKLQQQMAGFLFVVTKFPESQRTLQAAIDSYDRIKGFTLNGDINEYCTYVDNNNGNNNNGINNNKNGGRSFFEKCEAATDVIVVLDTSASEADVRTQKEIIAHLANRLDMWRWGTTMTVYTDQRSDAGKLELITAIENTTSSACAACSAVHLELNNTSPAEKDAVVGAVHEILKTVEYKEKTLNGARGKVVIFCNFQEDEKDLPRLTKALSVLFKAHNDVKFIAIGNNRKVLETYTRGITFDTVLVPGKLASEVSDELQVKICRVPSELQYDDCANGRNERSAVFNGHVSPNATQRWAMSPKYFFKSLNPKIRFESDGLIEVCQSRTNSLAEVNEKNCKSNSRSDKGIEYPGTNPCEDFTALGCSAWYFTVRTVKDTDPSLSRLFCQDDSEEGHCKTMEQVRFKVSHDGIRCSSCPGLISTPAMLIACFAAYILNQVFGYHG